MTEDEVFRREWRKSHPPMTAERTKEVINGMSDDSLIVAIPE